MFSFFRHPRRSIIPPSADDVIREISCRSLAAVRQRVASEAFAMCDAELRGYVRARATRPVRHVAEQVAQSYGWQIGINDALFARSLDRTVHLVVHQMRTQAVVAPSAVHATLRLAG
jgi:hypothetical protein